MSETRPVYQAKENALPHTANVALRYRRVLAELREITQCCTEIAEERDRAIVKIEELTKTVERLRKQLAKLRGEKEEA